MATLEKPKQKKKKKVNPIMVAELPAEPTQWSNADIEFPSTSTSDEIEIISQPDDELLCQPLTRSTVAEDSTQQTTSPDENNEVFLTTDVQYTNSLWPSKETEAYVDDQNEKSTKIENEKPAIEESATNESDMTFTPTAPVIEEPTESIAPTKTLYPDLQKLEAIRAKNSTNVERIHLQPFTNVQLKEFYHNPQIVLAESFETDFINTELNSPYKDHPLYDLIKKYSQSRYNLKVNTMDLQDYIKSFQQNSQSVWIIENRITSYEGVCNDGERIRKNELYEFAVLNEQICQKVSSNLNNILQLVCYSFMTNLYACESYRTQIEQNIREMLEHQMFSSISTSTPIVLNESLNEKSLEAVRDIRIIISILFHFLRRPMPDREFSNDIKKWLGKLVAFYVRLATWQDHLFLAYHVLRCPTGIASWAISLIQIPKANLNADVSPFACDEVNHCVTFLKVLLMPTKQRNEFLTQLHSENGGPIDATTDDLWIVIDSDGEEDKTPAGQCAALKENDLIALLNQVPFEHLFSCMTFTTMNGARDLHKVNEQSITGYHLLKFIAFSTNLVELFGEGLKTYGNEKYKQFAKLLSRMVRHSVQYVSDMHSIFKSGDSMKDDQLCARIQIEFDTFVLRSSHFIYLSRSLGAWQYLAILPFSELHISTIWKLYYMLTTGFSKELIENVTDDFEQKSMHSNFLDRFNDTIFDVPAEDMYYLLQTFSSMALARADADMDFIRCVTVDLFKVGFTNNITKDTCYKIVRDLLVNVTTKYTDLISNLLFLLKENFKLVDKYGTYLFKSLPLDDWHPSLEIFAMTSHWLMHFGFETRESATARTIFSRLNWNFDKRTGELFLPYEIHVRMASLIVDVSSKHVPETIGVTGISESVRQMSNLVKGQQTPHQQFITWCWIMVSVLRLHCFDQNVEFVRRTVRNPADALHIVCELDRLPSIAKGVNENRPIAVYLSVMTTLWGHSVPQICHKGFAQMQNLLNDYRYSSVIRCLHLVTPFFMDCPESLCKCAAFQSILLAILQADRTYIRMAKDFISSDCPGPVVEMFSNMIQAQTINYFNYGLQTPTMLIVMWLNCLTVNPIWYKDSNALFIVDVILRVAYQFADAWLMSKNFFKHFCQRHNEPKSGGSSTFIPFLSGSQQNGFFAAASVATPWLALLTLEIEHEIFEADVKLWPEFIRQLHASPNKLSMDNAIKTSAKLVGCSPFAANSLVLYKLANLIVGCPYREELLPIFCQIFFRLYLVRIRYTNDETRFSDVYGVADRFYDHNISLMKKLKNFFIDGAKFEKERWTKSEDEHLSDIYSARARLYNSYELWLEETKLNKINQLRVDSLPAAYDLHHLAMIFSEDTAHWTEYIQLSTIRHVQREASDSWLRTCLRYTPNMKAPLSSKATGPIDPAQNIVRHLSSYDAPIPPPDVPIEPLLVKKMSLSELKRTVLRTMQNDFKKIDELSKMFHMDVQELSSLDSMYKEMLRVLHENKSRQERREVRCGSILSTKSCKGGTFVKISMPYHEINEIVNNKLNLNRQRHETLINKLVSAPKTAHILPIVQIQFSIKRLLEIYRSFKHLKDEQQLKEITAIANTFFYYMINAINENINSFHPAQDMCTVVLSQLGIFLQDNQNTEGMNLLKTALKRPDLIQPISDVFLPSATLPEVFLQLYKFIIESHMKNCDPKILFVLLSKFDVNSWLAKNKPKLADINQLIQLIVQGLECWNKNESALIQGVLRRHLIHIFMYDFPEHYGEVLLIVLKGCSENKLMPSILMELLNTIYKLANCSEIDANSDVSKMREEILYFATNQQLFSYRDLYETIALFARHFQNERLQHGLNGLYPIHKDYCRSFSIIYETFGFSLIVSAVHTNPGALSDSLVEYIWPSVCEMFSPWLFPYYPQNMPNLPANWIRQFNTAILLPWSELYAHYSQMLMHSFINCIQLMLETFPACDLILSNIFYWYETNFGNAVPRHVLLPTNASLMLLPWNRLKPTPLNISGFHRLLQQYLPECHSFLGHIFLRVTWVPWLYNNIHQWDPTTKNHILSTLLLMFVKLSYEPSVRENQNLLTLLQEAASFPWYMLDYQGVEGTFDWYVMSTEPSSILCLNSEHSAVDNSILSLLQTASSIIAPETEYSQQQYQVKAKRILYVKSIVRLLRLCGSKYQQLLTTADGSKSFHSAIFNLLALINGVSKKENEIDAINMMIEVIGSIQLQGEFTSRMFVEALSIWQSNSEIGNILVSSSLNAFGTCKTYTNNMFILMESTVFYYFRHLESTKDYHAPSWSNAIERLGPRLPPHFDLQQLLDGEHLLCIHIHMIYKLIEISESGAKIAFLENVGKLLENFRSTLNTESKLAIIWGMLITCGHKLLETNSSVREPLLTLARHLKATSNVNDGWGEGILGAIGLKRDTVSNKRRIMAKCLACIIFSLFAESGEQRKEYDQAFDDLKNAMKSKKFADIRTTATKIMEIIENQTKDQTNTKQNVCAIIRLFYNDCFLVSLEDIWSF